MNSFSNFFNSIGHYDKDGNKFTCWHAKYPQSTMILSSAVTNTPLAALVFRDLKNERQTLVTSRPPPNNNRNTYQNQSYFQCMVDKPNTKFTFTLINLARQGYINFNILHTPTPSGVSENNPSKINEVDPGPSFGINQVNEIRPESAYTVEVDQRTNRHMILDGLTRQETVNNESTMVPVSVDQDEASHAKPKGLYFYLSVVPEAGCEDLLKLFKEGSVWSCTSTFILTRPTVSLRPSYSNPVNSIRPINYMNYVNAVDSVNSVDPVLFEEQGSVQEWVDDDDDDGTYDYNESLRRPKKSKSSSVLNQSKSVAQNVGQTQAGKLEYGDELITVQTSFTGKEYEYDITSPPTILCLSIWDKMQLLPVPIPSKEEAQSLIEEYLLLRTKNLMKDVKIYYYEHCCIDLTSEADTVIATCGHQCINSANVGNLNRCPICRSHVSAFIKADCLNEMK